MWHAFLCCACSPIGFSSNLMGESRFELESLGVLDLVARFSVDAFASVPIWSEQKGHPNLVACQVSPFPQHKHTKF